MRQSSRVFPTPPLEEAQAGAPAPTAPSGQPLAPLGPPLAPLSHRPVLAPLSGPPIPPLAPTRQPPIPPLPSQRATSTPGNQPEAYPPPAVAPSPPPQGPGGAVSGLGAPPPPPLPPLDTAAAAAAPHHDAREPASIAGLTSPAASSGGGHPGNASSAAVSAVPQAASGPAPLHQPVRPPPPPLATQPAGAKEPPPPQQQLHGALVAKAAAPPPPPLQQKQPPSPPPPLAVSATAATAAAAAAKHTPKGGPAPAAAPAPVPVPPPSPPPAALLRDVSVKGLAPEMRPVEEYIPFGFVELRGRLIADHPQIFKDAAVRKGFEELCKWISLRNTLRLALDYGDAHEKYAPVDPEKDTLELRKGDGEEEEGGGGRAGGLCGCCGTGSAGVAQPSVNIRESVVEFRKELEGILEKAEFDEMPTEDLEKAKHDKSLMGLAVETASDEYLEYHLYYRGSRTKKIQWRRWGLFKRQVQMNVYERVAISFRLKKPVSKDDVPADNSAFGVDNTPWYKRLLCGRQAAVSASLLELRDDFVYLKLFKDVLQCDVDMLLPGAVIKFTWLDYCLIWGPILFGFGFAVWKAIKGTIRFNEIKDAVLSVVLIVMPLTWGVRAYMAIKEKQRLHQARLNALVLMHNLNNNAGVVSQLLEEAQEQEDNEAMLAYFFLWRGAASPEPMRKLDLDRAVEAYLQRKLDDAGCAVRMDFEVIDSVDKLERMGLLRRVLEGKGEAMLQVVPLDEAVKLAHVRNFDDARETGHPLQPRSKAKRQGALGMAWHECMDIFAPTGQTFRYWWNAETGESTYYEPDEPYVKLGAEAAQEFTLAHGYVAQPQGKNGSVRAKSS